MREGEGKRGRKGEGEGEGERFLPAMDAANERMIESSFFISESTDTLMIERDERIYTKTKAKRQEKVHTIL